MSLGEKALDWLTKAPPSGLGIEFRQDEMVMVRFHERRGVPVMDLCLKAAIPPGVVRFSMLEPNIREPDGLVRYLKQILEQAGVHGSRLSLTLPDTLAHISVLEVPEASRSARDLPELIQFRLRKALPFAIEQARVAFEGVPGEKASFVTGIMHRDVVTEYERLLENLGFHVGLVQVSSLSLLGIWQPVVASELPQGADYFFLNVEQSYFTVVLVRKAVPILVRTLGRRSALADGEAPATYSVDEMVREIVPTLIFYREKLGGSVPGRVYYRSLRPDLDDLTDLLESQFEATAEPFDLARAVTIGDVVRLDERNAAIASAAAGAALGKTA